MKRNLRLFLWPLLLTLMLLVGLGAGAVLDRQMMVAHAQAGSTGSIDVSLIQQAWDTINRVYVDRSAVQSTPLTYGAISGMVSALGDTGHSSFLTPEMVKQQSNSLQGQFEGIGAQVQQKNGQIVIVAPMDNSPALKAGVHPGDIILKVNGKSVDGLTVDQVVSQILGPAGTPVTITLADPKTGDLRDLTIVRARITIKNVTWQRIPGTNTAHLRLAEFSQGVTRDLQNAIQAIRQQGMTSIIFDLRNDPGGELGEAIGVASQFLSKGDVLLEKDAQGQITHVAVRPNGVATDMPMVVLVNAGTASASEIVAGAIQDAKRATILGDTTFGTGTVLQQFDLSDGSALLLATQEWLTPSGRVIWHKGIVPDQTVSLSSNVNILTPEQENGMTAAQLTASGDTQLLKALDLIKQAAVPHG